MTDPADLLAAFSDALAARTAAATPAVVAVRLGSRRHLTGIVWQSQTVLVSAQSLPRRDEFELVVAGGAIVSARPAGRDPSTNIAILQSAEPIPAPAIDAFEPRAGAVALAIGADGTGGASARLGIINLAGPAWRSSQGGLIDRRIVLDIRLGRREEGGPVFDAAGGWLGMSTFGPRGQVLVIPAATLERVAPVLLRDGRIQRGWLGVGLQAVAVPDALRGSADQSSGLMVMSVVADGPAARAGLLPGDILLSIDGTSTHRGPDLGGHFGAGSVGQTAELRLIRGGQVVARQATIAERPAE
jgi:S1-C subfamily serine protease